MSSRAAFALLGALGFMVLVVDAQAPGVDAGRLAFEVASVKRVKSAERLPGSMPMPRVDRYSTTSVTLRLLMQMAYRRRPFENRYIVNGPNWIDTDDFDINATIPEGAGTLDALYLPDGRGSPGLVNLMWRTLLEDRFKLVVHAETREIPVYALTPARTDRRLGPRMVRSDVDCDAAMAEMVDALKKTGKPPERVQGQAMPCSFAGPSGRFSGNDVTMQWLADWLMNSVNRGAASPVPRPVIDRTGLDGRFDLTIEWTPDDRAAGSGGISIFTALQEQLGLKLESTRGPVEVLVIDRAEPPTPD